MFNPELQLTVAERAHLVALMASEGFHILNRVMRSEVDKFILKNINANPADADEVLASHRMSKAAAQFYEGLIARLNEEQEAYIHMPRATDKPVDVTDGLLDLDSVEEFAKDLPNILGGE